MRRRIRASTALQRNCAAAVTVGDFAWHSDENAVVVIDGDGGAAPPQDDIYEVESSRLTLDSHPDVFAFYDIWWLQVRLEFEGAQWSDDSLPIDPLTLVGPKRATIMLLGDSTQRLDLGPSPMVLIRATLAGPILGDVDDDDDIDGNDFLLWQQQLGGTSGGAQGAGRAGA